MSGDDFDFETDIESLTSAESLALSEASDWTDLSDEPFDSPDARGPKYDTSIELAPMGTGHEQTPVFVIVDHCFVYYAGELYSLTIT